MLNYKFRLYPTEEQEARLVETLDGCRWVYNYFLSVPPMTEYDMNYALVELKEKHTWLKGYHSKMLQMVGKKLSAARKALSVLKKKGYRVGRPHYITHEEYNSFTYNQSGFRIDRDRLNLSKIGSIKIVLHRLPINIKQVTIVREAGNKWYAVIACETLRRKYCTINCTKPVGIDVGITKFAHDSDDHVIQNPLILTKMSRSLNRASRRLSKRQKGSSNYEKAKCMRAKLYRRINNKRRDFLHKLSHYYAQKYDMIFVERLRVQNMTKNHRLARYILDSGWRTFKEMLEYKANRVIEVEPAYTSIMCSRCDNVVPKTLAVRTHRCNKCGLVIDRDYNSGLNILQDGLSLLNFANLPVERREITPVEIVQQSMNQETHVLKRESFTIRAP